MFDPLSELLSDGTTDGVTEGVVSGVGSGTGVSVDVPEVSVDEESEVSVDTYLTQLSPIFVKVNPARFSV